MKSTLAITCLAAVLTLLGVSTVPGQEAAAPTETTAPETLYTPPPCTGLFTDVPCNSQFADWIEQMYRDSITTGCGVGLYCPDVAVTRRQMAIFLERAMRGTQPWTPGDITGVTTSSGSGLTGGAQSGSVSLALAPQGVLASHIGDGQVTQAKLAAQPTAAGQVLSTNGSDLEWHDSTSGLGGAGAASRVAIWSGASTLTSGLLFWKEWRLGLGIENPTEQIDMTGSLKMPDSNATGGVPFSGVVFLGSGPFLHNYGFGATFVGKNAGNFTSYSAYSTAVGANALQGISTGSGNTAVGYYSLMSAGSASDNTAVGVSSLRDLSSGQGNTAVGMGALSQVTQGTGNIALGDSAGAAVTTGSDNILIGHAGLATESNAIRIGDAGQSRAYIMGILGSTVTPPASQVMVSSGGQLGTVSSSRRVKQDILDIGDASDRLFELRPVSFHYKEFPNSPLQYGLIAEEVELVMPELVIRGEDGQPASVAYHELAPLLLNELQKQQATIVAQREALDEQAARLAKQEHLLELLAAKVATLEASNQAK